MPVQDNRISENNASVSNEDFFETILINLVEPSILESVQSELIAFENRLLCGYSTLDTLPKTELKLVMLFIDNFSRIFRLWHGNSVFKNSIPSKTFYDVFSLMFRSFNSEATSEEQTENGLGDTHLSNLTGVCEICEEEFLIIENDAKRSYAEHERSEAHIKLLNSFNKIGILNENDDDFKEIKPIVTRTLPPIINSTKKFTSKFLNVFAANECFLELRDKNSPDIECECHLCNTVCEKQSDLIDHCNSKIHKKHKLNFFSKPQSNSKKQVQFNDDLIYTNGNSIYCVLCQCVQPKKNRIRHKTEEYHREWKNFARKILNLEEPYFHVINKKSEIAFCALCCTKFPFNYGIVSHCQTKTHIFYKHFADEIHCVYSNSLRRRNK